MTAATASFGTASVPASGSQTVVDDGGTACRDARRVAAGGVALGGALLYGGLALGVLAGLAASTYFWRQRAGHDSSPLERAEQLIASCESKLATIEEAVAELRGAR